MGELPFVRPEHRALLRAGKLHVAWSRRSVHTLP